MLNKYKVVGVKFREAGVRMWSEKVYTYLTDIDLKIDDWVVVPVFDNSSFHAARVEQISSFSQEQVNKASRVIVSKIDLSAWEAKLKQIELQRELEDELDELMKAEARYSIALKYAETNPKIKEILMQLGVMDTKLVEETQSK